MSVSQNLSRMHGLHLATSHIFLSHRQNLILALLCFSGMLEWQCGFEFEKQVYHPPAEHHIFSHKTAHSSPFFSNTSHSTQLSQHNTQPTSQSVSTQYSPFSPHSQNPSTKNPSVYRAVVYLNFN